MKIVETFKKNEKIDLIFRFGFQIIKISQLISGFVN